jgi:CheY-like chemotaxis protein
MCGRTQPGSVLIVDDYEDTCSMYAAYLSFMGYTALTAGNGLEALRIAAEAKPDVIFMDLNLPGLDGLEVTRRLKADPQTSSIPVIALTAHAFPWQSEAIRDAGFADLLIKPCLPGELATTVERIVRERIAPAPVRIGRATR